MISIPVESAYRPASNGAGRLLFSGVLSLLIHALLIVRLAGPAGSSDHLPGNNLAPAKLFVTFPETFIPEPRRPLPVEEIAPHPPQFAKNSASGKSSPLPLPRYYVRSELTSPPRILIDPGLDDPHRFPTSEPGKLELRIFINEAGHVDSVVIISSTFSAAWAKGAAEAFAAARFEPGRRENVAVRSQIRISVEVGDPVE